MNHLERVAIVHSHRAAFHFVESGIVFDAAVFVNVEPDVERFKSIALEPNPVEAGADERDEAPFHETMEEVKHSYCPARRMRLSRFNGGGGGAAGTCMISGSGAGPRSMESRTVFTSGLWCGRGSMPWRFNATKARMQFSALLYLKTSRA